jgi:hypothetical protein
MVQKLVTQMSSWRVMVRSVQQLAKWGVKKTHVKSEADSVVPVRTPTVKSMQQDTALINKGRELICSNDRNWEQSSTVKRTIETVIYSNASKAENFLNIIPFSICKCHKTKHLLVFCVGY